MARRASRRTYHVRRRVRTEPRGPRGRTRRRGNRFGDAGRTATEPADGGRAVRDGSSSDGRACGRASGRADSVHALRLFAMKTLLRPTVRRRRRRRTHSTAVYAPHDAPRTLTHTHTRRHIRAHTPTNTH